ncbi:hypothetical protein SeMB42_g00351 [Synchytrium endobioticum]|uniref:Uncharacterized protein n=1 Tax=Synchytrium endobioticum TaxID=286115 RepID=A0A507DFU0_9FUNG|nr:hypothetical protein SeLEV6574_g00919 [Synchytrium endobioticum]TPX54269.1 hypothetical protein SeMB42_g00349 [Synchytrium endobioticum]TPX54281.1 hypothetical protein SeMB42_g00351 [Synchytrium endobioticum]
MDLSSSFSATSSTALERGIPLSICQFARSPDFDSSTLGVVEIMILHAIDKCIHAKVKWIMALELTLAASKTRKLSPSGAETIFITVEADRADNQVQEMLDLANSDASLSTMERIVAKATSVLTSLLRRHGLLAEILPNQPSYLPLSYHSQNFTKLRIAALDYFYGSPTLIQFQSRSHGPLAGGLEILGHISIPKRSMRMGSGPSRSITNDA